MEGESHLDFVGVYSRRLHCEYPLGHPFRKSLALTPNVREVVCAGLFSASVRWHNTIGQQSPTYFGTFGSVVCFAALQGKKSLRGCRVIATKSAARGLSLINQPIPNFLGVTLDVQEIRLAFCYVVYATFLGAWCMFAQPLGAADDKKQKSSGKQQVASFVPKVIHSVKNDRTIPLRDMKQMPPRKKEKPYLEIK